MLCSDADLPEDGVRAGTMWECPDLFPLGGRHVLAFSAHDHAGGGRLYSLYTFGDYQNERFIPRGRAT